MVGLVRAGRGGKELRRLGPEEYVVQPAGRGRRGTRFRGRRSPNIRVAGCRQNAFSPKEYHKACEPFSAARDWNGNEEEREMISRVV